MDDSYLTKSVLRSINTMGIKLEPLNKIPTLPKRLKRDNKATGDIKKQEADLIYKNAKKVKKIIEKNDIKLKRYVLSGLIYTSSSYENYALIMSIVLANDEVNARDIFIKNIFEENKNYYLVCNPICLEL